MNEPKITIGYSSLSDRVSAIDLPSKKAGTEILIAVQGEWVEPPDRDDVRMIYLDTLGAAKSRNEILRKAEGEIVFFGDDDMHWKDEGLIKVVEYFDRYEDVDLVLCQSKNEHGDLRKKYLKKITQLSRFNSAKAATYEIVIRLAPIRENNIYFHEDYGAGTKNYIGDEFIFISAACNAGLKCEFLPTTIAFHPSDSSGMRYGTLEDSEARSNVFEHVFSRFAVLARLGFVVKNPLRFRSPKLACQFIFRYFPK